MIPHELRDAARRLSRGPLFAGVAVLTLSLSIGANGALFSMIEGVLLRPLPFERAEELYTISSTFQGARREFTSFSDFTDWRAESRAFQQMAAVRGEGASISTPHGAEYLQGAAVSEDFFALVRVQPFLGRAFRPDEHQPGQGGVAVLSHRAWRRLFGGDSAVVGASVRLAGDPHVIVGVAPAGFDFPEGADFWRPLTLVASDANRRVDIVRVVGRLRSGMPVSVAQGELTAVAERLATHHPGSNAGRGVELVSLGVKSTEHVRRTLLGVWGAVACVLLMACTNIGIMLLARGTRRESELAIRAVLGASRGRVVRQLLTEGALLGGLGGLGGILVAHWGIALLRSLAPAHVPRLDTIGLGLPVMLFTGLLAVSSGLLVGLVPAWRVGRLDLMSALRAGAVPSPKTALRAFSVLQVVVSVVLLAGAGLMVQTLGRLQAVPLGFDPDRLLTFYVALPGADYREDAQRRAFFGELLERIRAQAGVRSASAINAFYVHWGNAYVVPVLVEGRPTPERSRPPETHVRIVEPDIHRVLEVPILRGRSFTSTDGAATPAPAVINETMAKRHFGTEDPIGRRISVLSSRDGPIWQEIVGVVGDVRQVGLDTDVAPEVQVPYAQTPVGQMAILVRTSGDPLALVPTMRTVVQTLDPNLPLLFSQTMDETLARSLEGRRFGMRLLSIFSGVALLLAVIGIYAVMSDVVRSRLREMSVRLVLGATPSGVVAMILGQTLTLAVTGVGIGLLLALGATRYLEPLLFGLSHTDALVHGQAVAILLVASLLGGGLAARRVMRLDPASVLKSE